MMMMMDLNTAHKLDLGQFYWIIHTMLHPSVQIMLLLVLQKIEDHAQLNDTTTIE